MTALRYDQATQAKLSKVKERVAQRDRLAKIKLALSKIAAELEAAARASRRSYSAGEYREERWLREVESLRLELEMLEI